MRCKTKFSNRAAQLILDYMLLSSSFYASKCQIKVRDPRLHQISVAAPSFLLTNPISEAIPYIALPFQRASEEEATPSQSMIKEEEKVVEVFYSKDDFEVFNQPLSLEVLTCDFGHLLPAQASHSQEDPSTLETMGIQCKTRQGLRDLMESQVGGDTLEIVTQTKLPPPPLPSTQPLHPDLADHKRKMD